MDTGSYFCTWPWQNFTNLKNLKSNLLHEERHSFFPAKVLFLGKLLRAQNYIYTYYNIKVYSTSRSYGEICEKVTILLEGSYFSLNHSGRGHGKHLPFSRPPPPSRFIWIRLHQLHRLLEKKDGGNGKQKYFEKGQVQKAYIFFHLPISSCFFVTLNTWYHLVVFLGEGERDSLWIFTVHTRHWWPLESWDLTVPQIKKRAVRGLNPVQKPVYEYIQDHLRIDCNQKHPKNTMICKKIF